MIPTGDAITFLFSDIEGATSRWELHRAAMSAALARHDALMRAAIEAWGGQVFKTVGDPFYAAFAQLLDALNAAVAAQRALLAEDWTAFGGEYPTLQVRIGLHTAAPRPAATTPPRPYPQGSFTCQ
jgi:class 3 adenylate cyclase